MKAALKNVSLLGALIVVVYLVANYGGSVKSQLLDVLHIPGSSVQGASTERAQEISEKFKSDIGSQLYLLADYALNLKLADAITGFSRLEKIPKDINSVKEFTQEQIENFSKKK